MFEPPLIAMVIAGCALAVSLVTLWLTFLRRGQLRMTQPTVFFFGPDGGNGEGKTKIFLRTLLYSTARRGHIIENMHVCVSHNETKITYPIWILGDEKLTRGSGLLVGEQGLVANHHYLRPAGSRDEPLKAGDYIIEVFAKLVGEAKMRKLGTTQLTISDTHASELLEPDAGIYFDWGPESQKYLAHVDRRPDKRPNLVPSPLVGEG